MVWGVILVTLRQRVVPNHLLGRVGSVYSLLDLGGAAIGSLLGGTLARTWGLTTPFWDRRRRDGAHRHRGLATAASGISRLTQPMGSARSSTYAPGGTRSSG